MKRYINVWMMALFAIVLAACSTESELTQKLDNNTITVSSFPKFSGTNTRSVGTFDAGKTAWANGDEILVKLSFTDNTTATGVITYDGTDWNWATPILQVTDVADVEAYYAPAYEWSNGTLALKSDKHAGTDEYLTYTTNDVTLSDGISIDFTGTRTYSRLRVVTEASAEVSLYSDTFTANDGTSTATGGITTTADAKCNAYFYGNWTANTIMYIRDSQGDTLTSKTVAAASESGKSYALGCIYYGSASGLLNAAKNALSGGAAQFDRWIVTDEGAIDNSNDIRTALKLVASANAGRRIFLEAFVADLGEYAFGQCTSLSSVSLPKATSIGEYAFGQCTSLSSVSLPNATSIGDRAFYDCTSLSSVSLPKATSIGEYAFGQCTSLSSVSLPKATSIGEYAFGQCTSLSSVSLPNATSIGDRAFSKSTSLSSVSLPNATSIGDHAFLTCTSLYSVSLPNATSIGEYAFYNCTSLYSVSLPKATSIGEYAFGQCTSLSSVSLPKATSIGEYVFRQCTSLSSVSLPNATSVGEYAFLACTSLSSVSLPNATSIGDRAFYDCISLSSVSLPNATSIGDRAFYDCTSLSSVSLPNATSIGDRAFSKSTSLVALTFGTVITSWGNYVLYCTTPANITLTLNAAQTGVSGNTFQGYTFKEIILK